MVYRVMFRWHYEYLSCIDIEEDWENKKSIRGLVCWLITQATSSTLGNGTRVEYRVLYSPLKSSSEQKI